jgi:hypothetical protein
MTTVSLFVGNHCAGTILRNLLLNEGRKTPPFFPDDELATAEKALDEVAPYGRVRGSTEPLRA